LEEEGIENSWARHAHHHAALKVGLEAMGLMFIVDEEHRLPQLNSVTVPDGIDEAEVRSRLLKEYDLEIGAGLGVLAGKVWRIGLMGFAANQHNVLFCLLSLDAVLTDMGAPINSGEALKAAEAYYNK